MLSPYDKFADDLFAGMLTVEQRGEGPELSIGRTCRDFGLPGTRDWIMRFLRESNGIYGTNRSVQAEWRFELNAAGRARAAAVLEARRPLTLRDKLIAVPRSDWIALGAFVVSLIALFK